VTWQWAAGAAAAGCDLYAIWPYVRELRTSQARPSPVGWAIWAPLCAVWTVSLGLAGGRAQLGLPATETVACTVIAVWAWRLARQRAGRPLDAEELPRWLSKVMLASTGVALAVVLASVAGLPLASPGAAVCLLVGVDLAAGAVVVNGLRSDPGRESVPSWWWYGAGEAFTLITAVGKGWVFWASPVSGLLIAAGIIGMAWRGGERISRPRFTRPPEWTLIPVVVAGILTLGYDVRVMTGLTAPPSPPATTHLNDITPPFPHGSPRAAMPSPPPVPGGHLPPGHHIQNGPVAAVTYAATAAAPLPSPAPQAIPSPSRRTQRDEPGPDPAPTG